jgi:F-type H+-transporting ATPase subunit b
MRIDWWTLALQTINLVVLVWLLGRFLLRPLAGIVAERQAAARRLLDDAEAARAAVEAERQSLAGEREAIAAGKAAALAEADREAEARRKALLDAAHAEADGIRDEAQGEAARILAGAERDIGRRAGALAVDICTRAARTRPALPRRKAGCRGWPRGSPPCPRRAGSALRTAR